MTRPVASILTLTLTSLALTIFTGCSPWSTYPPIEHTAIIQPPTNEPVPTLMARAIADVNHRYGGDLPSYSVNLPAGVPPQAYVQVLERLPEEAFAMTSDDEVGYHVTQVRSRGAFGEVDVIHLREDGLPELVTVYLKRTLRDWEVDRARAWRIRTELPTANYVPLTDEEFEALQRETRENHFAIE